MAYLLSRLNCLLAHLLRNETYPGGTIKLFCNIFEIKGCSKIVGNNINLSCLFVEIIKNSFPNSWHLLT
mgnify:CR=1 FL=1